MTMSRADFVLIAEVLKDYRSQVSRNPDRVFAQEDMAELFAARLASTNPRFNRERFLKACGIEQS